MSKQWYLLILWALVATGYANETPHRVYFEENEKIELALSPSAYNKVFIANEKITNFHFVNGDFVIADTNDMDEFIPQDDGSIYIVPLSDKKPILYLTTNKGHHVAVEVKLAEGSGQVVGLAYGHASAPKIKPVSDKLSPDERALKALVEGKMPAGFNPVNNVKPEVFPLANQVALKLIRAYANNGVQATIYQVQNKGNAPLAITPQMFAKPGTRALTLSGERLNPQQSVYVYTLMEINHA